MRYIALILLLCSSFLFADVKNVTVTPAILQSGIKVVDIRTLGEWRESGVPENALTITFFQENGSYDVAQFIKQLKEHGIDKSQEVALICRSGNRTTVASELLSKEGFNVINLKGGVGYLVSQGYTLKPYGR